MRLRHADSESTNAARKSWLPGDHGGRETRHLPRKPRTYLSRGQDAPVELEFMKARGLRPRPRPEVEEPTVEKQVMRERSTIEKMLKGKHEDIKLVAEVYTLDIQANEDYWLKASNHNWNEQISRLPFRTYGSTAEFIVLLEENE
jgi:hypothetical protein